MADTRRGQKSARETPTLGRLAARLGQLESLVADLIDAHTTLDEQAQDLHYKVCFTMDLLKVRLRKAGQGAILDAAGKEVFEEGSITQFWHRDGATYVAELKAEADALEKKIAGADAIKQAAAATLDDISKAAAGAPDATKH